jgi:hypothetical protein
LSADDRRAHKTRDLCTSLISDRNRRIPFISSQVIEGWDSAELQCLVSCCLWKSGFHTSDSTPSVLCRPAADDPHEPLLHKIYFVKRQDNGDEYHNIRRDVNRANDPNLEFGRRRQINQNQRLRWRVRVWLCVRVPAEIQFIGSIGFFTINDGICDRSSNFRINYPSVCESHF